MKYKQDQIFNRNYQRLNPAQKKAVDTIEGPVMVIAGPGTGKTQVLTTRIAQILRRTDTNPTSILALTFTESAATNMRERLAQMIGKTAYYVQISTFHAFAGQVIKENPEYFPLDHDGEALTELDRFDIFETIIMEKDLDVLKPMNRPLYYIKYIISALSDLKREGLGPDDFKKIVTKNLQELENIKDELTKSKYQRRLKYIKKNLELVEIYRTYQKKLRQNSKYDFDDMINMVISAFEEHKLLLRDYQENLLYFLVDEYQDTNSAQNRMLQLLTNYWQDRANIFVVGDPNQSIYRFQGASVENMLGFAREYAQAKIVTLNMGYRCPQKIYDAAHELISQNKLDFDLDSDDQEETSDSDQINSDLINQTLVSQTGAGQMVQVFEAASQQLEVIFIAEEIKKLINKGVKPENIGVLYRNHADATELIETLDKWQLDYELDSGDDVLLDPIINQLLSFFQVTLDYRLGQENEILFEVMNYEWLQTKLDLSTLSVLKLSRIAGKNHQTMIEAYETLKKERDLKSDEPKDQKKMSDQDTQVDLTDDEFHQLQTFFEQLLDLNELDSQSVFMEFFTQTLEQSGFLEWLMKRDDKGTLLNKLNSLFNEIKSMNNEDHQLNLKKFLSNLALMREHNIRIVAEDLNIRKNAVHLSTVHRAKGMEWKYVFIMRLVDKKWGNSRRPEYIKLPASILTHTDLSEKEQNEDDRRLFYVALTRASQKSYITYCDTVITDNRSKDVAPSLLLHEIGDFKMLDDSDINQKAPEFLAKLLSSKYKLRENLRKVATKGADKDSEVGQQLAIDELVEEKVKKDRNQVIKKISQDERDFYQALVNHLTLNVTSLNKYLRDPKEFVEDVLLRIPKAKSPFLAFGTAIHNALEYYIYRQKQIKKDNSGQISLEEKKQLFPRVFQKFEESLKKEVLVEEEFKKRLNYGQEVLEKYLNKYVEDDPDVLMVERYIGGGFSQAALGDIRLSGRIDRVDWVNKDKKTVKVVDYKTGKPKSVNYIEGKTLSCNLSPREQKLPESVRGPYKRQLLFYKLLTDLDYSFVPKVVSGEFDFVEPRKSGTFARRTFSLSSNDVKDLKKLIQEVVTEIRSLKFLEYLD